MSFRNRIVRRDTVDPRQVKAHPQNWRLHPEAQVKALEGLLDEVGWVGEILWNERTGNLIDGHARIELAIGREEAEVPRIVVDLSEEEERLVLATLDPISTLADRDDDKLRELLGDLPESFDLLGVKEDPSTDFPDLDLGQKPYSQINFMIPTIHFDFVQSTISAVAKSIVVEEGQNRNGMALIHLCSLAQE